MTGLRGRWPIWGIEVSDQTVGNVLQRHGLPPAPERKRTTTWAAFIRTHLALLAGTDFFTAEVLTLRGLVTYYVLFFIHLESRRVDIAGITVHPDEPWMKQIARNVTMEGCGALRDCRYLLHDRDTKFTRSFRAIIASGRVEPLVLPARSPNLNAYAERWVRSVKEECLSKVILFGERSLRRALSDYVEHFHAERNHQGKGNVALLAGTDFFTAEVLTLRGLVTYYVLFFIHLESRRVDIAGITVHPDEPWMQQIARNVTMEGCGALRDCRYLLHDRDTKYTQSFRAIIASGQVEPLALPARSPNLNAYAERWVRSVKEECLSKVILFGERSLRRALSEYVEHYHAERNHQGKGNVLLFPRGTNICRDGPVQCRERLGGLLRYYHQEAA